MKDTYTIEGMTCASCAQAVEKSVAKLTGMDAANVNLATEKLTVTYDNQQVSEADITQAVENAGYKAVKNLSVTSFEIEGMTCASCAQAIEKSVSKLAAVSSVNVNLATEKMTVTFDEAALNVSDIVRTVEDTGYQAKLGTSEQEGPSQAERQSAHIQALWRRFLWSTIFTVPLLYIAMGPMLPFGGLPLPEFLNPMTNAMNFAVIQLLLTLPVVYLGRDFYKVGFKALFKGHPNMDSLIAIGTGAALAQANVGIAIGSGTDVAIESADIVLMRSDLMDVPTSVELSKATILNIKQNLFWAFAYNVVGIPIAMGILYLFGGPLLSPMFAGAAMSLSSVSVLLNAIRLKCFKV